MTLDEAIKHCLEVAGEQQERADSAELIDILDGLDVEACKECATDHRQLAEWLTELKDLKEVNEVLMNECDRLIKEKGELLKKAEQIAEYKRLLKAAVEDMKDIVSSDIGCRCCKGEQAASCVYIKCWTWRYADEALALIGEEGGNNA